MSAVAAHHHRRRPHRRPHQGLRHRRHRRARPRRRRRRPSRPAASPPSWARRARASRRSCTASPASTRHRPARCSSTTSSSAALSDKELTRLRRERLGFVFQSFNLLPTLTALENITLPSALAGRQPDPQWLDAVIDAVGLRDRLPHRPSELSGGQQQRVAVARALASRPADRLRRRADRQPRLPHRRRDPRLPAPRRHRPRPDDRDGHPRPGRRQLRRRGRVPRRRPHRRPPRRPRRRSPCSTASRPSGADVMLPPDPQGPLGPQAPPRRHRGGGVHRRRLPRRHARARRHPARRTSTPSSPRPTPAPTPSSAAPRRSTPTRADRSASATRGLVDAVARADACSTSTASPRRRRRSRATASSSARDGDAIGGIGPPPPGRQLDRRPGAQPVPHRRGPRPAGRRRGRHQPRRGQGRRPPRRRHHDRGDARSGDGAHRRHRHLRHRRRRSGRRRSPRSPCPAAQRYLAGGADEASSILVHGDGGVSQDELVDAPPAACCRRAPRRSPARRLTQQNIDDINATFLDVLTGRPHGLRRRRPARRRVQHLQHVLDPRGAADAGVGAAAGPRRQPRARWCGSVVLEALFVGVLASVAGPRRRHRRRRPAEGHVRRLRLRPARRRPHASRPRASIVPLVVGTARDASAPASLPPCGRRGCRRWPPCATSPSTAPAPPPARAVAGLGRCSAPGSASRSSAPSATPVWPSPGSARCSPSSASSSSVPSWPAPPAASSGRRCAGCAA